MSAENNISHALYLRRRNGKAYHLYYTRVDSVCRSEMEVASSGISEDFAVLKVRSGETVTQITAQNGFFAKEADNLPVITNGYQHHEEYISEVVVNIPEPRSINEEIEQTTDGGEGNNGVSPIKGKTFQVEPMKPPKAACYDCNKPDTDGNDAGVLNGPDQVLPSVKQYNVDASGCVRIENVGNGYAALKPVSVPGLLRKAAQDYPEHVAMASRNEDGTWVNMTYRQYEAAVRTCAKAFIKLGLKRYHSVCILGFNAPPWFISDIGAIYAGGFAAGIYTTNTAEACFYCALSSSANIIVVQDKKQLAKILEVRSKLPKLKAIIQYEGKPETAGVLSWDEVMQLGSQQPDTDLEQVLKSIGVNECCTLVYTSGTTGNPKAVMLSHDNLTWTSKVAAEYLGAKMATEVLVSYLPLSHVAAQIVDIYYSLTVAATVYFGDSNALKGSLVSTLQEAHPSQFLGVPRVWEKIKEKMMLAGSQASGLKKAIATWAKEVGLQYNLDRMNGVNRFSLQYHLANLIVYRKVRNILGLDRCRLMLSGAAPLATDIKKYFWSLDLPLMEGFGMSESAGCHTMNINEAFRLESIGKTVPGCMTKIDHPDLNSHGEILMKGRNIFMGYLNELPKTVETFTDDGWFRSGDVGTIDRDGYVYITGRIKELLITAGGENICPVLIEDHIKEELPCIGQAILIGDKRKFLSVLLTLQCEVDLESGDPKDQLNGVARNWCRGIGCDADTVSQIVRGKDEKVYAAIHAGIERANIKAISNAQRVQKFAVLDKDFSLGGGELGPTMKVKRNVVYEKYHDIIESFYKDS